MAQQSITLQTSDADVVSGDVLGRVNFAASNESSGSEAKWIGASVFAEASGEFTASVNPTNLVFATSDADGVTPRYKITNVGHLIPNVTSTYNIGSSTLKVNNVFAATGTLDRIVTTGIQLTGSVSRSGLLFVNNSDLVASSPNVLFSSGDLASPKLIFRASGSLTPDVSLNILTTATNVASGVQTLSVQGSAGELFSITDVLDSGTIFSVNDISGLGLIEADADGTVTLVRYGSNVAVGNVVPTQKLHVAGNLRVSGAYYDSLNSPGTSGQVLVSTSGGTDWRSLSEIAGVDGTGSAGYVARWADADTIGSGVIYDNGTNIGIGTISPTQKLDVRGNALVSGQLIVPSGSVTFPSIVLQSDLANQGVDQNVRGIYFSSTGTWPGIYLKTSYSSSVPVAGFVQTGLKMQRDASISWTGAGGDMNATGADIILFRDAANTLGQSNGINAQVYNIYNTRTDASNYERAKIAWSSNILQIGTEQLGTGAARSLAIQTSGTNRILIDASGNVDINNSAIIGQARLTVNGIISTQGNSIRASDFSIYGDNNTSIFKADSTTLAYNVTNSGYKHSFGYNNLGSQFVWATLNNTGLGIGTQSPTQRLHISGNMRLTGALFDSLNLPGTSGQVLVSTSGGVEWRTSSGGSIDGTGSADYLAKWIDTDTLGTGIVYDNGTNVGVRTTAPSTTLDVRGTGYFSESIRTSGTIVFASGNTGTAGVMQWNNGEGTVQLGLKGGNVNIELAQDNVVLCYNGVGSSLSKGQVVYVSGAQGQRPAINLALANNENTAARTIGFVDETIGIGAEGFVSTFGVITNLDTSAFIEGSGLWLSATTPGAITMTRPVAPNHGVFLGWCLKSNASSGRIFVHVQNGAELEELHDVLIQNVASGQLIQYDSSNSTWRNRTAAQAGLVEGVGTSGYVARWTGTNVVGTGIVYDNGTNVGIGTTSSSYKFSVNGSGEFTNGIYTNNIEMPYVMAVGRNLTNLSTDDLDALDPIFPILDSAPFGSGFIAIGDKSAVYGSGAKSAIAIGNAAFASGTNAIQSVFIGRRAGFYSDALPISVGIGSAALTNSRPFGPGIDAGFTTAVGYAAGVNSNLGGRGNSFFGSYAGAYAKDGYFSTFIGIQAGQYASGLYNCVGIGYNGFGSNSLSTAAKNCNNSLAIMGGTMATNFNYSIAMLGGVAASGSNNVYLGYNAGNYISGNYNIELLNSGASLLAYNLLSNKLHVNRLIGGDFESKRLAVGNVTSVTNLSPDATLEVLPKATTDVGVIIQGVVAQTADFLQVQNSAGTTLFDIDAAGSISGVGSGVFMQRLGVGTSAPAYKVDIVTSGSNDGLRARTVNNFDFATIRNSNSDAFPVGNLWLSYGSTSPALIQAASNSLFLRGGETNGGYITFNPTTVGSTTAEIMRVNQTGVGIFTTSPTQALDVRGSAFISGALYDSNNSAGTNGQVLTSTATGTDWKSLSEITGVDGVGTSGYVARWSDTDTIGTGVIYDNGTNVGIGTASPSTKLHVRSGTGDVSESGGLTIEGTGTGARTWQLTPTTADTLLLAIPGLRVAAFNSAGKFFAGGMGGTSGAGARFTASTSGVTIGQNYTTAVPTPEGLLVEGRVGIGTTSPTSPLHVVTTSDSPLVITSNNNRTMLHIDNTAVDGDPMIAFDFNGSALFNIAVDDTDDKFKIGTGALAGGANAKLTLDSAGNVGIGTESPQNLLTIGSGIGTGANVNSTAGYGLGIHHSGIIVISPETAGNNAVHNLINLTVSKPAADWGGQATIDFNVRDRGNNLASRTSARITAGDANGDIGRGIISFATALNSGVAPSTAMTIINNGNVGVGVTPSTVRLQVRGSGNSVSLTDILRIENADGSGILTVRDNGSLIFGPTTGLNGAVISASDGADNASFSAMCGLRYRSSLTLSNTGADHFFRNYQGSRTYTSGAGRLLEINGSFNPSGGSSTYEILNVVGTINQIGGANGAVRGIYVNPTLTAISDYRAIETNNNVGWAFFAQGTAASHFNGNVGIGTTSVSAGPRLFVVNSSAAVTGVIVRGAASQTADLFQAQNSAGTTLFDIDAAGSISGVGSGIFMQRVGIGTANPSSALSVGSANNFTVDSIGNVNLVSPANLQVNRTNDTVGNTAINFANVFGLQITATNNDFQINRRAASVWSNAVSVTNASGFVGIGTTNPQYLLDVSGTIRANHVTAITKSFLIEHPTKPGRQLRYASLEGPENGVYLRGSSSGNYIILPDYWCELVNSESITVNLTPVGTYQQLWVKSKNVHYIEVGGVDGAYDYAVWAERKDVPRLEVEI